MDGVAHRDLRAAAWRAAYWALPVVLAAAFVAARVAAIDPALGWTPLFFDDFYYYLEAAKNFAAGRGSTFDGQTLTNGYHPLWFLLIAGLCALFGAESLDFFLAMSGMIAACSVLQYWAAGRLLADCGEERRSVQALAGVLGQGFTLGLGHWGLESALAGPALTLAMLAGLRMLEAPGFRAGLFGGLAVSLLGLARLDALGLAVLTLALAGLVAPRAVLGALRADQLRGAALGLLPLGLYFASNLLWFDGFSTVSSAAKTLAPLGWNDKPFVYVQGLFKLDHLVFGAAALGAVSLMFAPLGPPARRAVLAAGVVFPLALIAVFSVMSDWIIWRWYLYPLAGAAAPAVLVTARALSRAAPQPAAQRIAGGTAAALALGLGWLSVEAQPREAQALRSFMTSPVRHAMALNAFARAHPGLYAMGDRAGVAAHLSDAPILQMEGLMSDRALIEAIAAERPLLDVLRARGVRYLVTTAAERDDDGCWLALAPDPAQAGPRSPVMRARLCQAPVMRFTLHPRDLVTQVFDLGPPPTPAPAP